MPQSGVCSLRLCGFAALREISGAREELSRKDAQRHYADFCSCLQATARDQMIILPWFLAMLLAAGDEFVMSRLLRHEYSDHRPIWESDGKPRSIFWTPPECKVGWYITYASGRAGRALGLKMLFQTPGWVAHHQESLRLLRLHRILIYAFVGSFIAPFIIAALLQ